MAINFNITKVHGIGNTSSFPMTAVNENSRSVEFTTDVSDTKDPIFVVIDLTTTFISSELELLSDEGKTVCVANLDPCSFNIFPVTTYGCVNKEGKVTFRLTGISGDLESSMAIKIGAFSHIDVVNN